MLILDKRRAVERVMALTPAVRGATGPEAPHARVRRRTAQRVATYERGATPAVAPAGAGRKQRRMRPATGAAPA